MGMAAHGAHGRRTPFGNETLAAQLQPILWLMIGDFQFLSTRELIFFGGGAAGVHRGLEVSEGGVPKGFR